MKRSKLCNAGKVLSALLGVCVFGASSSYASSHREAPFITEHPKVDGTDFYLFNSYEPGREGYVTMIANYQPLQDAYGGPNYFALDPEARYDINIDNDGDSKEDITFRFRFNNVLRDLKVPAGGQNISVPLVNIGQITATDRSALNVVEQYTVTVIPEGRVSNGRAVKNAGTGSHVFTKPLDYVGTKTFPDYAAYASAHLYNVTIPGCSAGTGKLFVGQRAEGFAVNLGETFDLVNYSNPVGAPNAERNTIANKNITTLAIEVPKACLLGRGTTIGAWTTASLPRTTELRKRPRFEDPTRDSGTFIQVSRLGMPLVNEVVIGLKDKDKFNESRPKDDLQFAAYVTNPSLPVLLQVLFPGAVVAPTTPRNDLLGVFVTGVEGLNKFGFGEMQRLNTAIPAVPVASQNNLGVLGGDTAGFPNGRRPGDDVVDIALRVVVGALLSPQQAPSGTLPLTDGATVNAANFLGFFPYLNTPTPGSPDSGA